MRILMGSLLALACSISQIGTAGCKYTVDPQGTELSWTGYKTPKKVGVSGTFKKIELSGGETADTMVAALKGLSYKIDVGTTSSGDTVRDTRIAKILLLGTDSISGTYLDSTKDIVNFDININGKSQKIAVKFKEDQDKLVGEGTFDLAKFALDKNIAAFAEACKGRHEGKTWTDVLAKLTLKFKKQCS